MCLFAINTGLLCNFVGFNNKAINGAQLNGELLFFQSSVFNVANLPQQAQTK